MLDSIKINKVSDIGVIEKWSYAWIIRDVLKYKKPIPYNHHRGAVIWVKI